MKVFHTSKSLLHDPKRYFRRGAFMEHPEQARRYTVLRDALESHHDLVEPGDHPLAAIERVHEPAYVAFLRDVWARRDEVPGTDTEVLGSTFARPQMSVRPTSLLGLVGYYTADTSTPIRAGTWDAVKGSADCALAGAAHVAATGGSAYALCRPPGHHAYADSAGGFCFLNNSAIAAADLAHRLGGPVAILDIDVHHGNGTQGIFYDRSDVLTVSIHANPASYFPFYTGYADETGIGAGAGFNLNLALPLGTDDTEWLAAIKTGLDRIAAFSPAAMVVALGLDAGAHDPLGAFTVTTAGFARAGALIARHTRISTLHVQEGGYLCEALPRNLVAFLDGYANAR